MSIGDIMRQAQSLSPRERKELLKLLIDSLDVRELPSTVRTGAQIAALLANMEPIEFVDSEIEDPVKWVEEQRRKETNRF